MGKRQILWLVLVGSVVIGVVLRSTHKVQQVALTSTSQPTHRPMGPESTDAIPPIQVSGIGPWVRYQNTRAQLDFAFEYPQNWVVGLEEGRQQPYAQVIILGPRNAANSYSAGLTIRRQPVKTSGGLYENLEALIKSRRSQRAANRAFELLGEREQPLGQLTAWRSEFTDVVPLPSHSVEAKPTKIRTVLVQFAVYEQLYELSFSADTSEYPQYQYVFDHLLNSLRFTNP